MAMFSTEKDARLEFIESLRAERAIRAKNERETEAAIKIQAGIRGLLTRRKVYNDIRAEFDAVFHVFVEMDKNLALPKASEAFRLVKRLFFVIKSDKDNERLLWLCRYFLLSLDSADIKTNCITVALTKETLLSWISLIKLLLLECCKYLEDLRPEMPTDAKMINLYLHVLISFTSCGTWAILKTKQGEPFKNSMQQVCSNIIGDLCSKGLYTKIYKLLKKGLARAKIVLKSATLSAAVTLMIRPLIGSNFSENLLTQFINHTLTLPGLVHHLNAIAQDCVNVLLVNKIFTRCIEFINCERLSRNLFDSLEGSYALFILANLIHLGFIEKQILLENLLDFTNAATRLLNHCGSYVVSKKYNMSHWHPVLGWYSQSIESGLQEAMPYVVQQLQLLWNGSSVKCLFADLVNLTPNLEDESFSNGGDNFSMRSSHSGHNSGDLAVSVQKFLHKVFDQKHSSKDRPQQRLGTPETTILSLVCTLYQQAFTTLKQLKYDILAGLCYQDFLLPRLWRFICSLGSQNGLKAFLDLLSNNPKASNPEFQILILFADCTTYLVVILDDMELYEQQKPFRLDTLKSIALFCNQFIYKSIVDGLIDVKSVENHQLFNSLLSLLSLLYSRDSRRNFCGNPDFWLIKEIKPSHFLNELDKGNKKFELLIHKVPHILPHKDRVVLFRKYVSIDKEMLGLSGSTCCHHELMDRPSTLITVHRSRIVEDGYRQLSLLQAKTLKGLIRVKFINEQGLDEPGIDQDGVFKEFLEETIRRVFDPSLNLFRVTSESRLYPSSTSNIHENHLALFDFVGRMLGKAVYEGIVVEIPFASFVLNHILGRVNSRIYSSVDELPSLDAELYKNLTYIKHYDGDVRDLDLTFSVDEDFMGQVVTHELVPGGKAVYVTNENKISYIHLMAHFRLYVQIKDQLTAFVRGFRALINPEWLCLFSAPELQKLISGDTEDIALPDLKQHVQYYGGFHSSHRVISWLWDILENDFTVEERRLFLKFVTSCSKPPLLGFAYLVPPFSIRCVEVAEDQDEGDTLGSVIRGFLAIRKKDPVGRLPTASTCFNLLKLPNYQKKSTLREKLRYAIRAGTGFELS